MKNGNGGGNGSRWFRILDEPRNWEKFYRNRWAYDKSTRTSHGVNCSGSCSWEVFVKDGLGRLVGRGVGDADRDHYADSFNRSRGSGGFLTMGSASACDVFLLVPKLVIHRSRSDLR